MLESLPKVHIDTDPHFVPEEKAVIDALELKEKADADDAKSQIDAL